MGRKKACDANEGTCVRDVLLVELAGLLEFVIEPRGPPNDPPALSVFHEPGEPILRRDGVPRIDGRVCEDSAEPGRLRSVEAAVPGLCPTPAPSAWKPSPSSDPSSVIREEITLGVCFGSEVGNGLGKEALTVDCGDCGGLGERGFAILSYQARGNRWFSSLS